MCGIRRCCRLYKTQPNDFYSRLLRQVTDIRVVSSEALPSPAELVAKLPRSEVQTDFVTQARRELHAIIHGEDPRLITVVGPCSIHDLKAGREYAEKLATLAAELKDRMLILMRVYFEKPRTTTGWKGLIMDPQLNGTCDIPAGLHLARQFLGDLDPPKPRHGQVEQDEIGRFAGDNVQCCLAMVGSAHHLDTRDPAAQGFQPFDCKRLVVHQHDAQ